MGNTSTPSVHRCTECAKSYSRRENLVRHYRSAHDKNTPYACSLCSSRFTRSDLLSRHRKVHDRDSIASQENMNGVFRTVNRSDPATPEGRTSGAKRQRPTPSDKTNTYTPQMRELDPAVNIALPQQGEDYLASHSGHTPSHPPEYPSTSVDQSELLDWDLQWPFYGEGLNDANIDWTLDFLSQGISTHSPLDFLPENGDASHVPEVVDAAPPLDADLSGEELRAWPDQEIRPTSPGQMRTLHEPSRYNSYVDITEITSFLDARTETSNNDVSSISEVTRQATIETVTSSLLDGFCSEKGSRPNSFPPLATMDYFVQLYFAHAQARFPVLHLPTFDPNSCPTTLLMAIAIIGSSYSESNQGRFALSYLGRTRMSIKLMHIKEPTYLQSVEHLLAFLLVSLAGMWLGQKMAYENAECDRGELVVSCRRSQLLDCRAKFRTLSQPLSRRNRTYTVDSWVEWIDSEQRKRLGLCIYLFDCQSAAFFQRQPYISKAETVNAALPCSESFWKASTAWSWKAMLGPAEIPPSTYFLTTLTTILLYNEIPEVLPFPPLDEFCKTLYAYVLHSHVFEWRQTICMLNPTGLLSSPLSLAPQNIGNSLQERQRWLEVCLKNWHTNYGEENRADSGSDSKSSAGILLYHLAMLALHINFSDLHIVAGRSGSKDDIELAEQSLRNWLQQEKAQLIFDSTMQMLDAAYSAIAAGDAQKSGFELAICLFMSGLTFWAISRFGSRNLILALQQRQIPISSRVQRSTGYRGEHSDSRHGKDIGQSNCETSSPGVSLLLTQVADARDGLRSLRCHRLAVAFGDILDRFITEKL